MESKIILIFLAEKGPYNMTMGSVVPLIVTDTIYAHVYTWGTEYFIAMPCTWQCRVTRRNCVHSTHKESCFTGDPLHSRAACTQPCNANTHSRAHCSPGARLCEQWGHGCVNNGHGCVQVPGCVEGHPCVSFKVSLFVNDFVSLLWNRSMC